MSKPEKQVNEIERRYRTCEVRADGDGDRAIGHRLTWGDVYSVGFFDERIMEGALDDVIENPNIRALWNHDSGNVLGRQGSDTLRVSTDDKGITVDFDMPKSALREREALERGDVDQMSWGFRVGEGNDSWEQTRGGRELRTIHKVEEVFDFSPVTFPANPNTDVALRSHDVWRRDSAVDAMAAGAIRIDMSRDDSEERLSVATASRRLDLAERDCEA